MLTPDGLALSAPGYVGELARWITVSGVKPQPSLALAAALTTVAVAKCHRVRSETGLRTNLFIAGVAPSGAGKNHPQERAKAILELAELSHLACGVPASGPGLLRAVSDGSGRRMIIWDEFGYDLAQLTGRGSMGFQHEVLSIMMKLFSCGDTYISGKELSNADGQYRPVNIRQPGLVILAYSTPDRFWNCLSQDQAVDGFIARWLFVEAGDDVIENTSPNMAPPMHVVQYLKSVQTWTGATGEEGNLAFMTPIPVTATLDAKAKGMLQASGRIFDERKKESRKEEETELDSLWARGNEHVVKVAMTVAAEPHITEKEMEWAHHFVLNSLELIQSVLLERVGNNNLERNAKKLLRIVKSWNGVMTHKELVRKTQFVDRQERTKILDNLLDAERLIMEYRDNGDGDRSPVYYLP